MLEEVGEPFLTGLLVAGTTLTQIPMVTDFNVGICSATMRSRLSSTIFRYTVGYPAGVGSFVGDPVGAGIASFRLSRIFPCLSISSTFTMIWSPSDTSSATALTR